eukprot:Em0002g1923a
MLGGFTVSGVDLVESLRHFLEAFRLGPVNLPSSHASLRPSQNTGCEDASPVQKCNEAGLGKVFANKDAVFVLAYSIIMLNVVLHSTKVKESMTLQVVSKTETSSIRAAAREAGVDEKRVREWKKQEMELEELMKKQGKIACKVRKRLSGGGRKVQFPVQEKLIARRILQQRALHVRVLRRDVARFAKEIITNPSFKASPGWISRFMRRHKFVTRVKTTAGQSLPKNVSDRIVDYVTTCSKRIRRNQLPLPCIANMDETAIWADMPGNSTIEVRGAHTVQISTTGHDKQRITICLAAFADGTKLKPFVVFKGKRIPKEISNVHAAVIKMSDNGWMNEDLTMEWIATVWNDSVDPGSAKRMLVWDTFKCHFTSSVKSLLEESNTDIVAVPGGCTKILQPADVSWNAPFKARYRDLYTAWMSAQNHERTKAGNLRAPSKALMSPPDADDSEEDESEVDDEWSLTQGSDNEDGLDGVKDSEDEEYIHNQRKTNGGTDFPPEFLTEVYNAIKKEEIIMPEEHTGAVKENYRWKTLLTRSQWPEAQYWEVATSEYDQDLFLVAWAPTVAAVSYVFDIAEDKNIVQKAIGGFSKCASIAAHYEVTEVFDNLVISLCKFTTLLTTPEPPSSMAFTIGINHKVRLSILTLFSLAHRHGNILREGWKNMLDCLIVLYKAKLLPESMVEVEDVLHPGGRRSLFQKEVPSVRPDSSLFSSLFWWSSDTQISSSRSLTPRILTPSLLPPSLVSRLD